MKTFDDLKNAWKQVTPERLLLPDELKKKANQYRSRQIKKVIWSILSLMATFVVFIYIFTNYTPEYKVMYWGLTITGLAVILAIVWQTLMLTFLVKPVDALSDTKTFLTHWQAYQKKTEWGQRTGISIYFIMLSIGITLYLFEFAQRNWLWGIGIYAVTGLWIAFNWFYLRPRIIEKKTAKLKMLMVEAERISNQLE